MRQLFIADKKRLLFLSKFKRRILKHLWLVRILLVGLILSVLFLLGELLWFLASKTTVGQYMVVAKDFVLADKDSLQIIDNRVNVLILGKGGEGHQAPDLTDTIIVASISFDQPSVTLISLPRDIWIDSLRTKINSIYYYGNQKQHNKGIVLVKSVVEEILGIPIAYGVVVDFVGFEHLIHTIGDIKVDVENSFVDNMYPITGKENDDCGGDPEFKCRYQTVDFEAGSQTMNGETTLRFVRSRNAQGDEGTDLARAKRQQKVIEAVKDKLLTKDVIFSPNTWLKLKQIIIQDIETDLTGKQSAALARQLIRAKDDLKSYVLESTLENPPQSAIYDNLYIFVPKSGNWDETHLWVKEILEVN